jgi:molybdenum transport protein
MTFPVFADHVLAAFLADDAGLGDLTTHVLGIGDRRGVMTFAARDPMVVAGAEEAARILELAGASVELTAASGDRLEPGARILAATGPAAVLHRGWKVAQTLLEITSGMATATRRIVDRAREARPDVAVTCTRKNVPGAKPLSIKAIMAGGATPHRLGLSETILLFEEHRRFLVGESRAAVIARVRRGAPEKHIVVEVSDPAEGLAWAEAGADVIQAEKFAPAAIATLVEQLRSKDLRALVAAAGGVTAENAGAYAAAGAAVLVTSAPYTARPVDVAVDLRPDV